jgi:hypothetical protein
MIDSSAARRWFKYGLALSCLSIHMFVPAWAQSHDVSLNPGDGWVDSGIDFKPGDTLTISASGQLRFPDAREANGPEGLPRGFKDVLRNLPLNDQGRGALIGRIGTSEAARPFSIGAKYSGQVRIAGHLFIAINITSADQATGTFSVNIARTASAAVAASEASVPPFPQSLLDSVPKRVTDPNGAPGDRVNFILIGSQDQVQAALKAAGWVEVDRTQKEAVLSGLLATLSKEAYLTLPMSELWLYGRAQDFGYAQADPVQVVAARHHFRLWKAPFQLNGTDVWIGAGTHDIGFDRDQRNNGVTHKIDPNVDGERDYIRESLLQTGLAVKSEYMTPNDPVLTARTATGTEFTSDGRTLLVYLAK